MSSQAVLWLVGGLAVVNGCISEPTMTNLDYPLPLIEKAIQASVVKVKSVTQNKREFTSDYLTKEGRLWDPIGNDPQRVVIKIAVSGDRRPYDLDIETLVEERSTGQPSHSVGFKAIGTSKKLSQEIQFRIQNYLRQNSRRNLIDDFRAF
ncbi:MAG: hypothetical protein A4S09_14650 [Proteobacteria bacterium SG_bin7]|nr:MAG: hypothetical protein A4S09_14650 [Proteobacteria bacterium SG_bin7]